ncbi:MAG TPA: hypothetical protein DCZ10_18395 [Pelotomaculum sp.]|jgi:hypothetical protein|nr:hypothetical protein [Pelotomaculum sp.]
MSKLDNFVPFLTVTRDGEITGDYWTYISNFELRKQAEWAEYPEKERLVGELKAGGKRKARAM